MYAVGFSLSGCAGTRLGLNDPVVTAKDGTVLAVTTRDTVSFVTEDNVKVFDVVTFASWWEYRAEEKTITVDSTAGEWFLVEVFPKRKEVNVLGIFLFWKVPKGTGTILFINPRFWRLKWYYQPTKYVNPTVVDAITKKRFN